MWMIDSRPWNRAVPRKAGRPLRCLFINTSMPVGGAETLLLNLIRRLDTQQVRAEVVCLKQPGVLGEEIRADVPVHANILSSKWDARVLTRLVKLFRERQADAVVTVGAGDKMFWGRLAAHLSGVPVIASALHSTGWPDGVGRLNRLLTPITDAFIAVADGHGDFLRDFERFPDQKVRVIRNGIDCARFVPDPKARQLVRMELGLKRNTPVIGIVAALRPEKNHRMLLDVAARLRNRAGDLHWLIVGDGPERSSLEARSAKLGLCDRVRFLGTRQDTEQILASLDLFALCSDNEASPVSILEALACQVPVVATDVGSVRESIVEGETGCLVPAGDAEQMAARISRLIGDSAARARMGCAGRAHVQQNGSLESMVEGYQSLLSTLYEAQVKRQTATRHGPRVSRSEEVIRLQ